MYSVNELRNQKGKAITLAQAILDKAETENRSMSAEEKATWTKAYNDVDQIQERIDTIEKTLGLEARSTRVSNEVMKAEINEPQEKRNILDRPEYRSAFDKHLRMKRDLLNDQERRAIDEGTGTSGHAMVYQEFNKFVVEKRVLANPLETLCETIQTFGNYNVPVETDYGMAQWVGEGQPIPDADNSSSSPAYVNDPVVIQRTAGAYALKKIIRVSKEVAFDSLVDLPAYIGKNLGKCFGQAEFSAMIIGTGGAGMPTTQTSPKGLVSQVPVGNTLTTAGALPTPDEVVKFSEVMPAQYNNGSIVILPQANRAIARTLKDGNGRYLWNDLGVGNPSTLNNCPVWICNYMPTSAGNVFALHFTPSCGTIYRRGAFEIQPLFEKYADTGEIGYRGWSRLDFMVTDTNGLTALVLKS
jgi:HK97 family phage major capsid protein